MTETIPHAGGEAAPGSGLFSAGELRPLGSGRGPGQYESGREDAYSQRRDAPGQLPGCAVGPRRPARSGSGVSPMTGPFAWQAAGPMLVVKIERTEKTLRQGRPYLVGRDPQSDIVI